VALHALNGANRLFLFTGAAKVDVRPTQDDNLFGGDVQIVLDLELSDFVNVIDFACYVGLAAFRNDDADNNTTFAVQGAQIVDPIPDPRPGKTGNLPVLQASVAVQGAADNTSVLSISYQANLQVLVAFEFQVSAPGSVAFFGKTATINAGQGWFGQVSVVNPAPTDLHVTVESLAPQFAPPPSQQPILIPAGQTSVTFAAPNTTSFNSPAEVDVPIIATLTEAGLTSTATVKVIAI
jgi:hypothetical protein